MAILTVLPDNDVANMGDPRYDQHVGISELWNRGRTLESVAGTKPKCLRDSVDEDDKNFDEYEILCPKPQDCLPPSEQVLKAIIKANLMIDDQSVDEIFAQPNAVKCTSEFLSTKPGTPTVLIVYNDKTEEKPGTPTTPTTVTTDVSKFSINIAQEKHDVTALQFYFAMADLIILHMKFDHTKIPEERLFAFRPTIKDNFFMYTDAAQRQAVILSKAIETVFSLAVVEMDFEGGGHTKPLFAMSAVLQWILQQCKVAVTRDLFDNEYSIVRFIFSYLYCLWHLHAAPQHLILCRLMQSVIGTVIEAFEEDMQLLIINYLGQVAKLPIPERCAFNVGALQGRVVDFYRARYLKQKFWRHFPTFWNEMCTTKYELPHEADSYYLSCISLAELRIRTGMPDHHPEWLRGNTNYFRDHDVEKQLQSWGTLLDDFVELLKRTEDAQKHSPSPPMDHLEGIPPHMMDCAKTKTRLLIAQLGQAEQLLLNYPDDTA
uniref:SET domain-containing protein n=1 Tax=Steinernema glaseri TaxID=37863 RepID=A0A1I7Y6L9_9BILA